MLVLIDLNFFSNIRAAFLILKSSAAILGWSEYALVFGRPTRRYLDPAFFLVLPFLSGGMLLTTLFDPIIVVSTFV